MSNGVYGSMRPALVTSNDVEIWYSYRETRNSDISNNPTFEMLDSSCLSQAYHVDTEGSPGNLLEGLYNLRLPLNYFGRKGFYTVYIKPKEYGVRIVDVGFLSNYSDVRGIVFDFSENSISDDYVRSLLSTNNALVGYRIQYSNISDNEREDFYRVVTSNFKCEPITSTNSKVSYVYNESSTLCFVTVTPSTAPTFAPNSVPFIGKKGQTVIISNTKFNPIMLDIEMTEHDIDTVSNMLEGSKLRDLDNGLITTFDADGHVYHQSEHFSVKDDYTGKPIYEVNVKRENNIDYSQENTFADLSGE